MSSGAGAPPGESVGRLALNVRVHVAHQDLQAGCPRSERPSGVGGYQPQVPERKFKSHPGVPPARLTEINIIVNSYIPNNEHFLKRARNIRNELLNRTDRYLLSDYPI